MNGYTSRQRAQELGDRIRARRRSRGLSQERLGELCGMHRTYVGQIERGEVTAGTWKLVAIAEALEIDVGELVHGTRRAS